MPPSECFDDNTAVEFIDGLLSESEIRRVEQHAARCDACRQLLAELGCSPSLTEYSPTLPAGGEAHVSLNRGDEVGRFIILNRIGSGGMGVVFAALDPKLERKVALKLLHSPGNLPSISGQDAQMRLLREAQAIARLSHPNVISVYDVGMYKSEVYIAMEFVEGDTLTRWLRQWERPWQDVLAKFVDAGKALADAHAAQLVHRDFKPDNVLVGDDGRVRVMDFGLARSLYADGTAEPHPDEEPDQPLQAPADLTAAGGALDRRLTMTGALLGTPRYMAPEQFAGLSADARSDQFSFCVALYEALYGRHPFEEGTAAGLVKSPETTQVRPPAADSSVPSWLHKALLRGLSVNPLDRYASMGALLRALEYERKPQSRAREIAPVFVAVLTMVLAIYFYNSRQGAVDDFDDQKQEFELRLIELEDKLAKTIQELKETRQELEEAKVRVARTDELQNQLDETNAQLEVTLTELTRTQKELSRLTRNKGGIPGRPRLKGLAAGQIRDQIAPYGRDLEICFREWRERESEDQPVFAVRLQIDSQGTPRSGSRSGGLEDRVVYECVAGLLENLHFPVSDGLTVVDLGFRNTNTGLSVSANVRVVLPDPAKGSADAG